MEFIIEFSRKHIRAYMYGYTNAKVVVIYNNYSEDFEGFYEDFEEMAERLLAGYKLRCDEAKIESVAYSIEEAWENSRSCHMPARKGDFIYVNI